MIGFVRDIKNYLDLRKTIKKEAQDSPVWLKYRLRHDYIGRIYTVVNLPPEVTLSPDDPEEIRAAYVIDMTRPINQYLTSLNLQEIIYPEFKPIKGTDSYLVIYNPLFRTLTVSWLLTRIAIIAGLVFLQSKYGIWQIAKDYIISTFF